MGGPSATCAVSVLNEAIANEGAFCWPSCTALYNATASCAAGHADGTVDFECVDCTTNHTCPAGDTISCGWCEATWTEIPASLRPPSPSSPPLPPLAPPVQDRRVLFVGIIGGAITLVCGAFLALCDRRNARKISQVAATSLPNSNRILTDTSPHTRGVTRVGAVRLVDTNGRPLAGKLDLGSLAAASA
jgi:hypothetical protein